MKRIIASDIGQLSHAWRENTFVDGIVNVTPATLATDINGIGHTGTTQRWRQIVRNRIAFNHDARRSIKALDVNSDRPRIRAELWHAVY